MNIKLIALAMLACGCIAAEPVTLADFTRAGHGWRGNPRTRVLTQEGSFTLELTGDDPWLEGPAVAMPAFGQAEKLRLTLEAVSSTEGSCRLFFAAPGQNFTEEMAVNLQPSESSAAIWQGIIPLTAAKLRFRIDPPGSSGRFVLRSLRTLPLIPLAAPAFASPVPVVLAEDALSVEAGALRVVHDATRWNAFVCFINGEKMAASNPAEMPVYWDGRQMVTVPLPSAGTEVRKLPDGFTVTARTRDAGGAEWLLNRHFRAERGAVRVTSSLTVSAAREAVHLPWLTLFAGVGSFGESKSQALLPGVEYLENEPSSNEKEIRGAAANRRITETYKLCYPMMAIAAGGNWFSVDWQSGEFPLSPLFDSPDRLFNSGGHVLGLWSPAVGEHRFEGETVVYGGLALPPGKLCSLTAELRGGQGDVVTEAVGAYLTRYGLPPLPQYTPGFDGAVRLLAAGWLDSAARDGVRWRHAVWGSSFAPSLAEDVPACLLWLAVYAPDRALKERLQQTAREVIAALPPGNPGINGISHVRRITGALLYGDLERLVSGAGRRVRERAAHLAQNGGVAHYTPAEGKPDYASTLGGDHCNGFTAMTLEGVMQDAVLSGDEAAIAAALAALDQLTVHYAGGVPRGAQPWEMPLHTPDIVAAARLVRCYVLGYQLSGRAAHLEQARYWAWTGVSMVYLTPPVEGPIGLYATIGVMGATNWTAPNWIGQPVQWCGLVYRSALEDLARIDPEQSQTWQQIARGITITGLQMCFPADDPQQRGGLLPDYLLLKSQKIDGPAINPGTLQAHLAEAYAKIPMSTLTRLANGMLMHAPGEVVQQKSAAGTLTLTITAWPTEEYRILITRVPDAPSQLLWNGTAVIPRFLNEARSIIVPLKGSGTLEVTQ